MRICIIIPMYNERRIVQQCIKTVLSYTQNLSPEIEVAVVDDGSNDGTFSVLQAYKTEYRGSLNVLRHEVNKGYGAALRTGIAFAAENGFEYCLFMDSDLTNHPRFLKGFYEKMTEGYDYIKANRYDRNSGVVGVSYFRRVVSLMGNSVARLMFGLPLHDLTNGFRAVKTSILSKIQLKENGFAIILEELFLAKPLAYSYAEVPYVLTARTKDHGKTHFTYDLETYFTYFKYALKSIFMYRPVDLQKGKNEK